MTNGGFAAIAVGIRTLLEPGDEAIFLSPPWFFYEGLILGAGATPVRVRLQPPAFDINLAGIEEAITPRTRAPPAQHAAQPQRPRVSTGRAARPG